MSPLLKIRSQRDQMSAIERRIADFLLENAHLLRDYSSQQLAEALNISQSSVVKFSQKLGFKGYPDLKYSVGQAIALESGASESRSAQAEQEHPHAALADELWQSKSRAEEETRLINPPENIDSIASLLNEAGKVFVIGLGDDGIAAQAFAVRLCTLGIAALQYSDPILMGTIISSAGPHDVLLVFSEHGRQPTLYHLCRQFRERRGKVVSVTRHTANPLRAHADASLLISAHDERAHIEPLLYQSALQHLLDLLFVVLCEQGEGRLSHFEANLERLRDLQEP
ncbi:MAG TPA: MurR/RpiR family transcriptional regulator [Steroidobacteraceae bacterium]